MTAETITIKVKRQANVDDYLSAEHLNLIGKIAVQWSIFEAYLSVTIWDLLCINDRETGLSVTSDLMSSAKIKLFSSVVFAKFGDKVGQFAQGADHISSEATRLNTERNNLVHHGWVLDRANNTIKANKINTRAGKVKETPLNRSTPDLTKTFTDICDLTDHIAHWGKVLVSVEPQLRSKLQRIDLQEFCKSGRIAPPNDEEPERQR